jgi:hypothetical protein
MGSHCSEKVVQNYDLFELFFRFPPFSKKTKVSDHYRAEPAFAPPLSISTPSRNFLIIQSFAVCGKQNSKRLNN